MEAKKTPISYAFAMIDQFVCFLKRYHLEEETLLLGLSGGPDSMALLHLLLAVKHSFHVAHLDHGWRPESATEERELAKLCQEKGIRYHSRCLALGQETRNLEDRSRKARHLFFREVCEVEGLRGVLLGHHADDQAETVLKRVFEGATLPKLQGLSQKKHIEGLTIYRPLLAVRKRDILEWLNANAIAYFSDPTNEEARFLRSRMRQTLLPTLSEHFGKQIASSLCRLGETAKELSDFLEDVIQPFRQHVIESKERVSLDCSSVLLQTPFVYKAVIRDLFERNGLVLSQSSLETLLLHLRKNSVHKQIQVGRKQVEINRGILTIKKLKIFRLIG